MYSGHTHYYAYGDARDLYIFAVIALMALIMIIRGNQTDRARSDQRHSGDGDISGRRAPPARSLFASSGSWRGCRSAALCRVWAVLLLGLSLGVFYFIWHDSDAAADEEVAKILWRVCALAHVFLAMYLFRLIRYFQNLVRNVIFCGLLGAVFVNVNFLHLRSLPSFKAIEFAFPGTVLLVVFIYLFMSMGMAIRRREVASYRSALAADAVRAVRAESENRPGRDGENDFRD